MVGRLHHDFSVLSEQPVVVFLHEKPCREVKGSLDVPARQSSQSMSLDQSHCRNPADMVAAMDGAWRCKQTCQCQRGGAGTAHSNMRTVCLTTTLLASPVPLADAGNKVGVNMLSGLNATRHPVHKAAKPAPASQTNSAREHSACAIKPLKSVRGSPTRLSHHRDHRDNTRRTTRLGKKPFPPEQIVPHMSAIARQV